MIKINIINLNFFLIFLPVFPASPGNIPSLSSFFITQFFTNSRVTAVDPHFAAKWQCKKIDSARHCNLSEKETQLDPARGGQILRPGPQLAGINPPPNIQKRGARTGKAPTPAGPLHLRKPLTVGPSRVLDYYQIFERPAATTTRSYLRGKVGNVFFLALQGRLGHEAGEVTVLHAHLFDLCVDEFL